MLDQAPRGLVDVVRCAPCSTQGMPLKRLQVLSYCHLSLVDDTLHAMLPYFEVRHVPRSF